jgi:uncharacterized protein (TIGR03083 family)
MRTAPHRATVFPWAAENRLLMVDVLGGLTDEQWEQPTLCEGWTVRTLAGHLRQPAHYGFVRFVLVVLRHRGDVDRALDSIARRLARAPRGEVLDDLRQHAGDELDPPRVGFMGPFADTCLHLRDVARPLGLPVDVPREHWVALLDYLVSPQVAPALAPRGRADGLRLEATDADWQSGDGPEVTGPVEALAMALTGRPAALADLVGDGVTDLAARIRC